MGSSLVKLSGRQTVDGWPVAWSPDGKRIAFAIPDTYADQFIVEPRPPGQGQFYIMNVDGTGGNTYPHLTSRLSQKPRLPGLRTVDV